MYYPASAGAVTSFMQPIHPVSRGYYPPAPMSAVLPGQHYYPTMHAPMSAPVMYQQQPYGYGAPAYGAPAYYGQQPTVILSSRSGRHRHSSRSRSRSRGFLGYL